MRSPAAIVDDHLASLRLDIGQQSCFRFRDVADLPLDLVGETIAATSVGELVDLVGHAPRKGR